MLLNHKSIEWCFGQAFFTFGLKDSDVFFLSLNSCHGLLNCFLSRRRNSGQHCGSGEPILLGRVDVILSIFYLRRIGRATLTERQHLIQASRGIGKHNFRSLLSSTRFILIFFTGRLDLFQFSTPFCQDRFLFGNVQVC